LLCIFFRDVSKVSKKVILPSILFFVFALIPVITELLTGVTNYNSKDTDTTATAFAICSFIFIDLCNIIALLVVLIFSERWTAPFENSKISLIPPSSV
jgi:uncharacterized membrane protein